LLRKELLNLLLDLLVLLNGLLVWRLIYWSSIAGIDAVLDTMSLLVSIWELCSKASLEALENLSQGSLTLGRQA